jgi:hypothetical protein
MAILRTRRYLRLLGSILGVIAGAAPRAAAQSRPDSLQFAGVAYLASVDEVEAKFTVSRKIVLLAEQRGTPLGGVLLDAFRRASIPVRTDLARRNGLAVAFAFDDEYRTVETLQDMGFKVVSTLSGQILTIDFSEGMAAVVSALPVIAEYVDVQGQRPGPTYDDTVAEAMLAMFVVADTSNQFFAAASVYASLPPPGSAVCRVRLGVGSFDTVTARLSASRFGADEARIRQALNTTLLRSWVTAARQPMLPSATSQAEAQMQARFASGEIYRLRIPDPDYVLEIGDIRARRAEVGGNAAIRIDAVGLQFDVNVVEPMSRVTVARGTFRRVVTDTVPRLRQDADAWTGVVNSVKAQAAAIAAAARRDDRRWFEATDIAHASYPTLPAWLQKCAP